MPSLRRIKHEAIQDVDRWEVGQCRVGKTYQMINPATEEVIAELPLGGKADVDKAVAAARNAYPVWSKKSQAERSQITMKLAALLRQEAGEIGRIDTLDTRYSGENGCLPGS